MTSIIAVRGTFVCLLLFCFFVQPVIVPAQQPATPRTPLLSDKELMAIGAEINGLIAKDTVTELARYHRVQSSSGYSRAAE
ncbi:MAG TPA: hypothetical protein VFV34_16680, partial [Blastocatellia bacterium]|nr:hypothetical protein [Blastocatellia bacterium]